MALKFKCCRCYKEIILKSLKVGDSLKCPSCGEENMVPETAIETDEEPEQSELQHYSRSPEIAIFLLIITASIYWWFYMFFTLSEMEKFFKFKPTEMNPRKVRRMLIAYLSVVFVVFVILVVVGVILFTDLRREITFQIIFPFFIFLEIVFLSLFMKLIEDCQKQRNITPLNKSVIWWLMVSRVTLAFASVFLKRLGETSITPEVWMVIPSLVFIASLMRLISVLLYTFIFYLIVRQVNRVWS